MCRKHRALIQTTALAITVNNYLKKRNRFVYLVTRRGTLLMEMGLLHDYLGIFPCEMKDIIFT